MNSAPTVSTYRAQEWWRVRRDAALIRSSGTIISSIYIVTRIWKIAEKVSDFSKFLKLNSVIGTFV